MNFRSLLKLLFAILALSLFGCSDSDKEDRLVNLFTTASQDVIAVNFPAGIETTISINSEVTFTLQGLKSNGVDVINLGEQVSWSLNDGAISRIDQNGRLSAGNVAESITVSAGFGVFSESIDIQVSSAKFDRVVQLDANSFDIDMCRSQAINPIGRYVDENGNEEIRAVDSSIINSIEWIVVNPQDNSPSTGAYIETSANQPRLHTLAAGDLVIRAKALSLVTNSEVTSADFNQSVSNALNSIKLCSGNEQDLTNCSLSNARVEQDTVISLVAVGNYTAANGSTFNENISRNSKWGLSDILNASSVFSADRQQLDVTGEIEETSSTLSVACGDIEQSLAGVDITQGVNLNSTVSCGTNLDCLSASALITVEQLRVLSFSVSANGIDLTDNTSVTLGTRPSEITLTVNATFSNNSVSNITNDFDLRYTILSVSGQVEPIEKKSGSPGVFTVLGAGSARIELEYRNEIFTAVIQIP